MATAQLLAALLFSVNYYNNPQPEEALIVTTTTTTLPPLPQLPPPPPPQLPPPPTQLPSSPPSPPPTLSTCPQFAVPGVSPESKVGAYYLFSYITSYTWVPQTRTLYLTSLGQNSFHRDREIRNKRNQSLDLAFNHSFPYLSLINPVKLVRLATWGSRQAWCRDVRSAGKNRVTTGKIFTLKCEFGVEEEEEEDVGGSNSAAIQIYSKKSNACWEFDISAVARGGVVAQHTTRRQPLVPLNASSSSPSFVMCIAGLKTFTPHAREIIQQQMEELQPVHIYVGLNTHDVRVRDEYLEAFNEYMSAGTVSIIPPPAPEAEITFTQAKLPFLNECLMHAKLHGDLFAGVWDVDEIPKRLTTPSNTTTRTTLAQHLVNSRQNLEQTTCYVKMNARNCLAESSNSTVAVDASLRLGDKFPFQNVAFCSNYTKAIMVVPRVELVGIHVPESCDLYPKEVWESSKANFVYRIADVMIAHFAQLFSQRFTYCPTLPTPQQFCQTATSGFKF